MVKELPTENRNLEKGGKEELCIVFGSAGSGFVIREDQLRDQEKKDQKPVADKDKKEKKGSAKKESEIGTY